VLMPVAVGSVVVHVPLTLALRELWGLEGVVLALGVSTLGVLAALLLALSRRALLDAAGSLGRIAGVVGALGVVAFGSFGLLTSDVPAAVGGLAVYAVLLALLRPSGLRDAWGYLRELH
jgi:hypothetical protein